MYFEKYYRGISHSSVACHDRERCINQLHSQGFENSNMINEYCSRKTNNIHKFPYSYEIRPVNTLYNTKTSYKPFPMTNRPKDPVSQIKGYIPNYNNLQLCGIQPMEQEYIGWWSCKGYKIN